MSDTRKLIKFDWFDPVQDVLDEPALEIRIRLDPGDTSARSRIRSEVGQALFRLLSAIDLEHENDRN